MSTATIETRIVITNKMEREIPVREISDAEADVLMEVIKVVHRKNLPLTQDYARDGLMSYLNEEGYFLACKWDQKGGLNSLGGYIYTFLDLLCKDYRRNAYYHDSNMLAERKTTNDGEEAPSVWDKLEYREDLSVNYLHQYEKGLTDRQKKIMWMLYEGIPMKDIAEEVGLASRTIRKEKDNIRKAIKEAHGVHMGNGYYKNKRGACLPNMKGGN